MHRGGLQAYNDVTIQRLTGISRDAILPIVDVVRAAWPTRGRPRLLGPEDAVLVTLLYWRQYPAMAVLGAMFNISEASVSRMIEWVEEALIRSKKYRLQGKKLYVEMGQGANWLLLTQPLSASKGRVVIKRISIVENINDTV